MAYLTTTNSGQPVLILKEGTTRSRGKEAQRNNIMAARVIGEVLKTTLGPRGMDKMLIDNLGDITITTDGAAILNEIEVEHPAAKMMVEIAKTQDDMVQHFLSKEGIMAARRVKESDMEKLSRATGAQIVSDLSDLKESDLGMAGTVEERKIGDDKMIFVEKCKDPHSVAILIRAGLERMVDEAERAMTDALSVVSDVVENNRIVAGGGAVEIEIARELRKYATNVGGREQLAIEAFADGVEVIPRTLAENAGLDPIDILVALRSAHEKEDGKYKGVNVFTGEIQNSIDNGVLDPAVVKEQALKSAAESASMILRIDDVISSSKPKGGPGGPGGMPGGEGEE
jgi:chaperonin GroEL (HSP60 family)